MHDGPLYQSREENTFRSYINNNNKNNNKILILTSLRFSFQQINWGHNLS